MHVGRASQPVSGRPGKPVLRAEDLDATGPYLQGSDLASPSSALNSSSLGSGSGYFDAVARMIAEVADALDYAHQQGVIHRDIKPSNLLLSPAGWLSVNDFGLARMLEQPGMTMTGEFVGTPAYMSPEQITAGRIPLDHRSDIYSLGATLYELLTLQPPHTGNTREQVLAQIVQKEPKQPRRLQKKVPVDLETICLKCLEKDPDRRYASAKELADDLRRFVNRFAIRAKRASLWTRAKKWMRRNPVLTAAGLLVFAALTAAGFFAWRAHTAERQRQQEVISEKRQSAMEKAIVSAMSSRFAEADAALLEAERLGADIAERRFVAGILAHYRGDSEEAKRLLLEACGERPDWVAPRAFLSVVCNYTNDWGEQFTHGNAALQLTPHSAEDFLFRGYMLGLPNPQRGMPEVEEAWNRRQSVLAQFVRAEVRMNLAGMTGRVEDAIAAREALRGARAFMGDAPLLSVTSLFLQCVGCANCRIHGRLDEAKQWLADAADDFHAAERGACRTLPNSLRARTIYLYLRDGSAESLNAENREAGRKGADTAPCQAYLASLFRRDKTDDALEYLRTLPHTGSSTLGFSRIAFLVGRDTETAREECRRAVAEERRPHTIVGLILSLSLVGLHQEARKQARIFSETRNDGYGFSEFESFSRRAYAHVYEGKAMDVETEVADNSLKRGILANIMGFAALGRGDRAAACGWFRKADQIPLLDDYLMQAIRTRVISDPNWPPWLAAKKPQK